MLRTKITALCCSAAMIFCSLPQIQTSANAADIAHDPSRDVQTEGVGNPFGFGERMAPEGTSIEELRALNHQMTVQEVKYAL